MSERREVPVSSQFPARPVLDWRELWPGHDEPPDLRSQLPENQRRYLGPHDRVVCIDTPDICSPTLAPATLRELPRLFRVSRTDQIGQNGAPVAGLSSSENLEVEALRKFEVPHTSPRKKSRAGVSAVTIYISATMRCISLSTKCHIKNLSAR